MTGTWRPGPLSVPAFRLLTAGQFTSTAGDYRYTVYKLLLTVPPRSGRRKRVSGRRHGA